MDSLLWQIFSELKSRKEIRAVIWRAEGKSWSSGRDVSSIGGASDGRSHHQLMGDGHRGVQQIWEIDAPIICAIQGWAIGASFQRALLCDMRIAAQGARFMLPELQYGVIPDTGGVGVLYEMCGHGLVSDMVLTGRAISAEEALWHGIVSRVVPPEELEPTAREIAERIVKVPAVAVKMARHVIGRLAHPQLRSSMGDELVYQTFVNKSEDIAELRAARAEGREPTYRGT